MPATPTWTGDRSSAYYTHGDYTVQRDRAAGVWYIWRADGLSLGEERTLKLAKAAVEQHEAIATAERKWDVAIEAAKAERSDVDLPASMQSMYDAADCADQAQADGQINDEAAWYLFAVGVAANDDRSAHLFA
jgi:hypothetical protein